MKEIKAAATKAVLALAVAFAPFAQAQGCPNKPIRTVVPYPAGGGIDVPY